MKKTCFSQKAQTEGGEKSEGLCFSKKLVRWVTQMVSLTTIFGFLLAFYCVHKGYTGALGWVAGMVTSSWAAIGTVGGFYMSMAKSDHREGGITYEAAKANGFVKRDL